MRRRRRSRVRGIDIDLAVFIVEGGFIYVSSATKKRGRQRRKATMTIERRWRHFMKRGTWNTIRPPTGHGGLTAGGASWPPGGHAVIRTESR